MSQFVGKHLHGPTCPDCAECGYVSPLSAEDRRAWRAANDPLLAELRARFPPPCDGCMDEWGRMYLFGRGFFGEPPPDEEAWLEAMIARQKTGAVSELVCKPK